MNLVENTQRSMEDVQKEYAVKAGNLGQLEYQMKVFESNKAEILNSMNALSIEANKIKLAATSALQPMTETKETTDGSTT